MNKNRHDKHFVLFDVTSITSCCGTVKTDNSVCSMCNVNVLALERRGDHIIVTHNPKILKWYYSHGYKNVM